MNAGHAVPADGGVVIGIDAGGSRTRARAERRGVVVHEGKGGPGNPLMAGPETIYASYEAALDGCPAPGRVAACVSGGGGAKARAQIHALLVDRFPGANICIAADYVAAFLAAPAGSDVCVVAGTGSVICSRSADGGFEVSGGRGWILGDHGGAARLGRAALEYYVAESGGLPAPVAAALPELAGAGDWRGVVRAVHDAPNPAPLLARAAPLLTAAAENRQRWAVVRLDAEMTALAATAAQHIDRHLAAVPGVRVALSGGVWSSPAAQASFAAALARATPREHTVTRSHADPLDGAVRLGETMPS